jgi:hypothetical protein
MSNFDIVSDPLHNRDAKALGQIFTGGFDLSPAERLTKATKGMGACHQVPSLLTEDSFVCFSIRVHSCRFAVHDRVLLANALLSNMVALMGEVVVRDPEILGGEPVFAGTRVPVRSLFDHLRSR